MQVEASDEGTLFDLREYFSFYAEGYRFMPKYKAKIWDGKIRLFNPYTQKLYIGLLDKLRDFCKSYNVELTIDEALIKQNDISLDEFKAFADDLNLHSGGKKITPHMHQNVGAYHALRNFRSLLLSPTSSGKSLMAYMMVRYFQQNNSKKTLIVVPTTSLVEQMYSDFDDYASETQWEAKNHVHKIYSGAEKNTTKDVIVSTWQSIYKLGAQFYAQFDAVIIDEAHQVKAAGLTGMLEKCQAKFRIGMTGTLDDTMANKLVIQGLLGAEKRLITSTELMEKGLISNLHINCLNLMYTEAEKKEVRTSHKEYKQEIAWLLTNEKRNNFIADLATNVKGNTLVLFLKIEHGKLLKELVEARTEKKVFLVYGKTEALAREEVRAITEKNDDVIIIASYGVFSTGISIKNLHNIILASPVKSKIRLLQSIGRVLRLHESKDVAQLYDLVDVLIHKTYTNFAAKHFAERFKHYVKEKFDYSINRIKL